MSGLLGYGTPLCYDQKLEVFENCIGLTLPRVGTRYSSSFFLNSSVKCAFLLG
jgi:hypothetical protein